MVDATENDLLVAFERQQIPEHYKQFYVPKRHNLFATIQQFPYVWNCFMHPDKVVLREFEVTAGLETVYPVVGPNQRISIEATTD
jgi:hypothetical protein